MNDLTARLLSVPFAFPPVAGKSVFVLGLGGGCDVITALAVSERLDPTAARIVYGNTKVGGVGPVELLTPHVVKVNSPVPEPGAKPRNCGRAAIDHGVPRNSHGSPWIVRLDKDTSEAAVAAELASLGFDLLVGVDAGGDSVADQSGRGRLERDQVMLRVLLQTGVPVLHVVVAPGCDGESSVADLCRALETRLGDGSYRGCFPLTPLLPTLRANSGGLAESRTPCIVLRAADGLLSQTSDGVVTVPRGCEPVVPAAWLAHAFVFEPRPL